MKTTCAIIDDEPLAIELIKAHISKFNTIEIVGSCNNAIEGAELLQTKQVDLLFLDIQMPTLTGIEFLRSLNNPPKVILTTAYRDFALEGYELDVVDYLLKPISFDRFFKAVNKYFKTVQPQQPTNNTNKNVDDSSTYMYVNSNKKHFKVLFEDILYAESLKDYVRIHTQNTTITTKEKISDFEKRLPSTFLRIHRSYIVNSQKITAFTAQDIEIGTIEIPIGISYKQLVGDFLRG